MGLPYDVGGGCRESWVLSISRSYLTAHRARLARHPLLRRSLRVVATTVIYKTVFLSHECHEPGRIEVLLSYLQLKYCGLARAIMDVQLYVYDLSKVGAALRFHLLVFD